MSLGKVPYNGGAMQASSECEGIHGNPSVTTTRHCHSDGVSGILTNQNTYQIQMLTLWKLRVGRVGTEKHD